MTKNIKAIIIAVLVIIALALAVYYHGQEFRKKHCLTNGKVIRCDHGGKGNFGPGIHYVYEIDGNLINGSRRHDELIYSIHDLEGHIFPVVYTKNWFGYDDVILITPRDFAYYGYNFPDSLRWVLPYIK